MRKIHLKHMMNITERIKRSVVNRDGGVFLRAEFVRFGSPAQVGRALSQLTREGALVRLGLGIDAKAKPSPACSPANPSQSGRWKSWRPRS